MAHYNDVSYSQEQIKDKKDRSESCINKYLEKIELSKKLIETEPSLEFEMRKIILSQEEHIKRNVNDIEKYNSFLDSGANYIYAEDLWR